MRIDRVVAEFCVWLGDSIPFAKMRVKVLARSGGDFLAVPNLAIRSTESGDAAYISGLGNSVEEALNDLLPRFFDLVDQNTPASGLTAADFEWSAPEDF